ncbi:hypothetical protein [Peribacillus butanolivorans]
MGCNGKAYKKEPYELVVHADDILKSVHSIDVDRTDIPSKDKKERKLSKLE